MIVRVSRLWGGIGAITLWPFIIIRKSVDEKYRKTLLNHERIHLRQQLELLIILFYVAYLLNYTINLFIYRNHKKAYRNIIFEREAFTHEDNENYLETRKAFAFLKFLAA